MISFSSTSLRFSSDTQFRRSPSCPSVAVLPVSLILSLLPTNPNATSPPLVDSIPEFLPLRFLQHNPYGSSCGRRHAMIMMMAYIMTATTEYTPPLPRTHGLALMISFTRSPSLCVYVKRIMLAEQQYNNIGRNLHFLALALLPTTHQYLSLSKNKNVTPCETHAINANNPTSNLSHHTLHPRMHSTSATKKVNAPITSAARTAFRASSSD